MPAKGTKGSVAAKKKAIKGIDAYVDAAVFDAKIEVMDNLLAYVKNKTEIPEDIEEMIEEFKASLSVVPIKAVKVKKITAYHLFVREQMAKIAVIHPDKTSSQRMAEASKMWGKHKKEVGGGSSEDAATSSDVDMATNNDEPEAKPEPKKKGKGKKKATTASEDESE
jgi:hypothetical protein